MNDFYCRACDTRIPERCWHQGRETEAVRELCRTLKRYGFTARAVRDSALRLRVECAMTGCDAVREPARAFCETHCRRLDVAITRCGNGQPS